MTQTINQPVGDDETRHPIDVLINVVVTLLAPMFITAAGGNLHLARVAAMETVVSYRAHNHAGLIAVARIIGYGLAALGSLSLSMDDDLSIPLILKLRTNATALDRSGERAERALRAAQAEPPARAPSAEILASIAEAQKHAAELSEVPAPEAEAPAPHTEPTPMNRTAETDAALAIILPPLPRLQPTTRATLLSSTASQVLCETPGLMSAPPGLIGMVPVATP
jgi:hypothetical protein